MADEIGLLAASNRLRVMVAWQRWPIPGGKEIYHAVYRRRQEIIDCGLMCFYLGKTYQSSSQEAARELSLCIFVGM